MQNESYFLGTIVKLHLKSNYGVHKQMFLSNKHLKKQMFGQS
jgi:hypothetical protein